MCDSLTIKQNDMQIKFIFINIVGIPVAKPALQLSHGMQIFSCLQTVKQSNSKDMNSDSDLKFA